MFLIIWNNEERNNAFDSTQYSEEFRHENRDETFEYFKNDQIVHWNILALKMYWFYILPAISYVAEQKSLLSKLNFLKLWSGCFLT